MAEITLRGHPIHTSGDLPPVGVTAKDFVLVNPELAEVRLSSFDGKRKVLNIFTSIDTKVCATSLKTFYNKLKSRDDVVVLNISADLPFAFKRFCGAEGVENVQTLSTFRSTFAEDYGLKMLDGPLKGLCARSVIVLDADNKVIYTEQVPEVGQEPNYDAAIAAL